MKCLAFAFLALASTSAMAQQPPPAFAPITINEQVYNNLMQFLQDKPYYVAKPIIEALQQLEGQAQIDLARKKTEEKLDEEKK